MQVLTHCYCAPWQAFSFQTVSPCQQMKNLQISELRHTADKDKVLQSLTVWSSEIRAMKSLFKVKFFIYAIMKNVSCHFQSLILGFKLITSCVFFRFICFPACFLLLRHKPVEEVVFWIWHLLFHLCLDVLSRGTALFFGFAVRFCCDLQSQFVWYDDVWTCRERFEFISHSAVCFFSLPNPDDNMKTCLWGKS